MRACVISLRGVYDGQNEAQRVYRACCDSRRDVDYVIFCAGAVPPDMMRLPEDIGNAYFFTIGDDIVGCMRIFASYLFDPVIDLTRQKPMDAYRDRMRRFSPDRTLHIRASNDE